VLVRNPFDPTGKLAYFILLQWTFREPPSGLFSAFAGGTALYRRVVIKWLVHADPLLLRAV
jgi:hypothetical protein